MNPSPVDPRPATPPPAPRDNARAPAKPNEAQRRAFEKLMAGDTGLLEDEPGTEVESSAFADWGIALPPSLLRERSESFTDRSADEAGTAAPASGTPMPQAPVERPADIQVPAPSFAPIVAQQSNLYAHLAQPHGQADNMLRFEVLDGPGSLLSSVQLNTNPEGSLTVQVGTSVQHAALLDRYLPQLQRRLADKGSSAHVRVQERDRQPD